MTDQLSSTTDTDWGPEQARTVTWHDPAKPAAVGLAMDGIDYLKAMVAGTYPGMIISAAQRQAAWLHKTSLAMAEGTPLSTLLDSGFPRLHFSRKPMVETALRNFSTARLLAIIDQLATAALETRKQASLGAVIAQRALLSIAVNAKRRG